MGRQQVELVEQDEYQQDADQERGQGNSGKRCRVQRPIDSSARPIGGIHPQRNGQDQGESLSHHGELQCYGQPLSDGVGHLQAVGPYRLAQIAGNRIPQPLSVADNYVFVESKLSVDQLPSTRLLGPLLAQQADSGITGQQLHIE